MKKIRITKKDVCYLLSIKADKLRKLMIEDETFPRPIKDGTTRQAAANSNMRCDSLKSLMIINKLSKFL